MKILFIILYLFIVAQLLAQQTGKWGDQGNGTYRNPVIASDYSNPDVIRVGNDYYMVSSANQFSPGIQILHSKDLVNWKTIGAAFSDLSALGPNFNWDRMNNYRSGLYAPSIRHHAGKFWVFVNCYKGEGFWMSTATNPAGPWTPTQIKDCNGLPLRTAGWTDPCPFWDTDGKAYLAASNPGDKWYSYLFRMTPDGTKLLDASFEHLRQRNIVPENGTSTGTVISAYHSSEGNKIYQRNGYYYFFHIEFLNDGRGCGTYISRSKNIYGTGADGVPGTADNPGKYEIFKIGKDDCKGGDLPGQGSLFDTPDGRWFWMGQFNKESAAGRFPILLPVTWIKDWPVIGTNIEGLYGKMDWALPKPIKGHATSFPQGNDEFNSSVIKPQWQWNHQPRNIKWSLKQREGFLRLYAFPQLENGKFFKTGNMICQRYFQSDSLSITTKLDLTNMVDGQEAGIAHLNGDRQDYATMAIVKFCEEQKLKYEDNGSIVQIKAIQVKYKSIWFRSTVSFSGANHFAYSLDGKNFIAFGNTYYLKKSNHGDAIGMYTFNNKVEAGYIDIDWFHYKILTGKQ